MPLIYDVKFDSIHIDAKRLAKATMGGGGGGGGGSSFKNFSRFHYVIMLNDKIWLFLPKN